MNDTPLPGPLDEFLNHPPTGPDRQERQRDLLRETAAHLPRLRRMHLIKSYSLSATALFLSALCFIGVLQLPQLHDWTENIDIQPQVQHHEPPAPEKPQPQPVAPPEEKAPQAAVDATPPPAIALEWQAFDAPRSKRAALYFQAGDRYLADARDVASAMRCYTVAIDATPMESLEIQPDDNWLVTTLKLDHIERRKEK